MSRAPRPKSVSFSSLKDPRAKEAWMKAAWRDEEDDEQLQAAAHAVESINRVLADFHRSERVQDLAGYLWVL